MTTAPAQPPLPSWLERRFHLDERGSTVRREVWAGVTTFMVMAYIIFVNPAILSFSGIEGLEGQGPPFDQVLVATCIAAGLMTLVMGLVTNRPFALAPGMGLNALVAYQLILGAGLSWPEAMGVIVLEGLLISVLVLIGLREAVMHAIPLSLKHAIGAGIGFFILFIGLVNGGLVRVPIESAPVIDGVIGGQPATPLALGALDNLPVVVTLLGLAITVWLHVRGVRFAVLAGIALTTIAAIALNATTGFQAFPVGATPPEALVAAPNLEALRLPGLRGIPGVFTTLGMLSALLVVFSIMLTDFFDTMGTVIGVSEQMGDVDDEGRIDGLGPMLAVDSAAAAVGGALGASSVTTYIESAAGVAVGGRTGLASVVTAMLFLLAIFLAPVAGVIPPQATAPALILVGFLMAGALGQVDWQEPGDALPALLTMLVMPLTYSITNGIGAGFVTWVAIRIFQGKVKEIHPLMAISAGAFALYFALPWLQTTFNF